MKRYKNLLYLLADNSQLLDNKYHRISFESESFKYKALGPNYCRKTGEYLGSIDSYEYGSYLAINFSKWEGKHIIPKLSRKDFKTVILCCEGAFTPMDWRSDGSCWLPTDKELQDLDIDKITRFTD